jgi:hypothetical protein
MKINFLIIFSLMGKILFSQQNTLNQNKKTEREIAATHKALIIPFEPKLYLGEIDYNINAETKLSAKEIKFTFRDGLNNELQKAFKASNYNALDLMEDTAKFKKETETIYQNLGYEYLKVPNQEKYKAPSTAKEKKEKRIEKGQLNLETNADNRFMNAKINDAKLLPSLFSKYKTDIFVFINQLDIKAVGSKNPSELGYGNENRKIIVHYTILNKDLKEINCGIAEDEFDAELNNPKKIVEKHFSKIATLIVQRVNKTFSVTTK